MIRDYFEKKMSLIWPNGWCCYFSQNFYILQYFLLPISILFILRSRFLLRIRRFIRVLCKMEYIQRWRILPVPFLVINGVIMTSLLLLKIILMLAIFLISSNTFLSKYFSLYVYFERNLDSANKFNNMTLHQINCIVKMFVK